MARGFSKRLALKASTGYCTIKGSICCSVSKWKNSPVLCSGADSNYYSKLYQFCCTNSYFGWFQTSLKKICNKIWRGAYFSRIMFGTVFGGSTTDHWYRSWFFLSLQGLVSVSPGPPSQRNNFNLAKDVSIRFMPKASSYQQGFCSYWLWLHSSLGTITGRSVNAWRMVLGPLEWHIDRYTQLMILFFAALLFFFLPPPGSLTAKAGKFLLLQMVKEWVLCWGECCIQKFLFLPRQCRKISTPWRAYFSIGWAQSRGKAAINCHHLIFSSPPRL